MKGLYFLFIGFAILLSLIIFSQTFTMALVGDDYLGLWRIIETLKDSNWNYFNYFFTDYGPQDTITLVIYSIFSFEHWAFYLIAYIFRIFAALSLIPLIYYITKNKVASFLGFLFFLTTYTGLETNDWSFNMPSFLSIIAINFHVLYLFKLLEGALSNKKYFVLSIFLMILAIVIQPIRATFLPSFTIFSVIYYLIINKFKNLKLSIFYLSTVLFSFYLLIAFSQIGLVFGITANNFSRITLNWFETGNSNFTNLILLIKRGDLDVLLNPIIQLGEAFFPFTILPRKLEVLDNLFELFSLVSILFFVYSALVGILNIKNKSRYILIASIWIVFSIFVFSSSSKMPIHSNKLFGLINGGIISIHFLPLVFTNKNRMLVIVLALTVLAFLAPWIRQPEAVQFANNRYMIISAAGISLVLAVFVQNCKSYYKYVLVTIFISIHFFSSYKYFNFLKQVRNARLVGSIRDSIPYNSKITEKGETVMYYLEADNPDILYHSIGFGLPVILYFKQDVVNPWDIAVTSSYSEVISAITNGESLVRFAIPKKVIPIENIYSLRLNEGRLIDTTNSSREKLSELLIKK